MTSSLAVALAPIVVVAMLVATLLWVYADASAHAKQGTPVYFSIGSLEVNTPTAWAVGCLCLWIVFTPLYVTCRSRSG